MAFVHQENISLPLLPRQLSVLSGRWNLSLGEAPHLATQLPELLQQPPFVNQSQFNQIQKLGLPLELTRNGHHLITDDGYRSAALGQQDQIPISPVFVKDLSGRVIHTGLMPLPSPPALPLFPAGCTDVSTEVQGSEWIENAIFTTFRCLDFSSTIHNHAASLAQELTEGLVAAYTSPNQHPYKIRPDTFYQDGWRLPQTNRLFARNVAQAEAEAAAHEFMHRWQSRPNGQLYEDFYEANNGPQWFENFFLRGLTIIPTFEACNGYYQIASDFSVTGVEAGRAVPGLHQIVSQQPSKLPAGTILQVVEPGYVTANKVYPAQVVVSNGSQAPVIEPLPILPNLKLPHPRVGGLWGDVWLPTHPEHFTAPAIWDWLPSGHFVQIYGPLWDPLHYTYASVPLIIRAARKPVVDNPTIFTLPSSFRQKFYPIIPQNWFDNFNERIASERSPEHPLYGSILDSTMFETPISNIGYHPLPAGLEYELSPALFPQLNPKHRFGNCPDSLKPRLAQPVELLKTHTDLAKLNSVTSEPLRQLMVKSEETQVESVMIATQASINADTQLSWLPFKPASQLLMNVKRLFANRNYRQLLASYHPTLPQSLYRFRESTLAWRRLRYRLVTKYPAAWCYAAENGLDLSTAEAQINGFSESEHQLATSRLHHPLQRQAVKSIMPKPAPKVGQGGLPFGHRTGKLRQAKKIATQAG